MNITKRTPEEKEADQRCVDAIRNMLGMQPLYEPLPKWEPIEKRDYRRFSSQAPSGHGFFASGCRQAQRGTP